MNACLKRLGQSAWERPAAPLQLQALHRSHSSQSPALIAAEHWGSCMTHIAVISTLLGMLQEVNACLERLGQPAWELPAAPLQLQALPAEPCPIPEALPYRQLTHA